MGLLTGVVRSGVFGDHLLAATRRILYEHRIIIPGRRRLSELAGEAATAVERDALEVIECEIPASTRLGFRVREASTRGIRKMSSIAIVATLE